jgi:hypothetical protein
VREDLLLKDFSHKDRKGHKGIIEAGVLNTLTCALQRLAIIVFKSSVKFRGTGWAASPLLQNGRASREFAARMNKPKRIQRSRSKGWKMPANAIYVGRPTVWGNPYVVGSELMNGETLTAEKAVELYEQHLAENFSERDIRHCLRGKDLACWCALDQPCHADVLLRIANSRPKFQRK